MELKLLSMLLWAALFFGPPLALAVAAPLHYADSNARMGGKGKLHMVWFGLLFLCGLIFWVGLLKLVYLPAMQFDISDPRVYNFSDINALGQLLTAVTTWLKTQTLAAVALLAFPLLIATAIMVCAHYMGIYSGHNEVRASRIRETRFYQFQR